jgi:pimeloyl-ACP methyl ester carboxylesterase|tara:strand:- start:4040 stop:4846 length:807 start_codon:yes stop_codon:yes gene_type:complete
MYKEIYVHTNDVAINIAIRKNNENKINIVFVHGFLERWQSWSKTMDLLPKEYNLYSIDLRGFGRSGRTLPNHKRSTWASDISKILKKLELKNIYIIGHSLGGPIVSSVSSTNNDQVSGVVLEDPFLGHKPVDKTGRGGRGKLVAETIDNSKSLDEAINKLNLLRPDWREDIPIEIATARKFTDSFLLEVPRKFKDDFSIEGVYKNITSRTILYHSNPEFGGINSLENIKLLNELNPSIKIKKWVNSGHNIHRDFPDEFCESIINFINN